MTCKNAPDGSARTMVGPVPAAKGEPATAVKAPVLTLMVKAEMLLKSGLAAYRNFPVGSTVTENGCPPPSNGDPAMGVSAPVVELIAYAEILFVSLAT